MLRRTVGSTAAAVLCAVALALTTVVSSAAAPVRARGTTFEGAEAAWLVRRGEDVFIYFVFVFRSRKAAEQPRTRLFADRSRCRIHRVRGKLVASCALEGRLETIRPGRFEMDPGSGRAELDTKKHHVAWREKGLPSFEADPWVDTRAVLIDAYVERRARAWGEVFGRKVKKRSLDRGAMYAGIDVGVITDPGPSLRKIRTRVRVEL